MRGILTILFTSIFFSLSAQNGIVDKTDLKFYNELFKHFRTKSINKDSIDWNIFEKKVLEKAIISKDSAIVLALKLNKERHSFYYRKKENISLSGNQIRNLSKEKSELKLNFDTISNIGYIKIKSFQASKTSLKETIYNAKNYINNNISIIKTKDNEKLIGWIIDLRNNSGGDMWPMIISLTPFLKNGIIGYTVKNQKKTEWKKENGEIYYGKRNKTKKYLENPFQYKLKNNEIKIAVLINNGTLSSAEATAISLMCNANVRFFGTETYGFTTNNTTIEMKNGDFLHLTTGYWENYNGERIKNGIEPNYFLNSELDLKKKIFEWFKN